MLPRFHKTPRAVLSLAGLASLLMAACTPHERFHQNLHELHEQFHEYPHTRTEHHRFHEEIEDLHQDYHDRDYE